MGQQISHPYKTTGRIIIFYILIINVLDRASENEEV